MQGDISIWVGIQSCYSVPWQLNCVIVYGFLTSCSRIKTYINTIHKQLTIYLLSLLHNSSPLKIAGKHM